MRASPLLFGGDARRGWEADPDECRFLLSVPRPSPEAGAGSAEVDASTKSGSATRSELRTLFDKTIHGKGAGMGSALLDVLSVFVIQTLEFVLVDWTALHGRVIAIVIAKKNRIAFFVVVFIHIRKG